ncbi:MAG: acyl-CoA mutase large subunit family protein [Ignavibacteriales bacterium]|nr:acyl-CoA mutase large subunit family protein [Ignavibacteriales bacterium]
MDQTLPKEFKLRDEFAPSSYRDWRALAEVDLKGVPFEKKLITKTYENIDLEPLYTKEHLEILKNIEQFPGFTKFLRGSKPDGSSVNTWFIAQGLIHPLAENFNKLLLDSLLRGQTAVVLPLDKTTKLGLDADYGKPGETGDGGVSISGTGSLSRAFLGVDLTACPLFVSTGFSPFVFLSILKGYSIKEGVEFNKINGSVSADPVTFLFENGEMPVSIDEAYSQLATSIRFLESENSGLRTIGINGATYVEKGASAVQELGISMSLAVEAICRLSELGIDPATIPQKMIFNFGTSTNLFMEIAKFRAARILFSEVLSSFNLPSDSVKMFAAAKTSGYYHSFVDPYVNMLRVTTQAFSAIIGGVDLIETLPFDSSFEQPDEFSNRIARNTQIILSEESHLNHVIDAAGGSFYVETLTAQIVDNAWSYFREIEDQGGIYKAVIAGKIQSDISGLAQKRVKDVATRKTVIVGVNSYANVKEEVKQPMVFDARKIYDLRAAYLQKLRVSGNGGIHSSILKDLEDVKNEKDGVNKLKLASSLAAKGATLGEIFSHMSNSAVSETVEPITVKRPAHDFEQLRIRASAHKRKNGSLPKLYLFNVGPVKQHKARADFSRGFFEAGGFEVTYGQGVSEVSAGVEAAVASGAQVFVLCSTDDTYPELVPQFVKAIKQIDKDAICILAGYPKDQVEAHKQTGIDEFIFVGANVVQVINNIFDRMGVEK